MPTWIPPESFGARLLLLRHAQGLTVEAAARACDIPHPTWSTWEHGAKPRDILDVVQRIVCAFDVDRDWLLWGSTVTPCTKPRRKPTDVRGVA